MISVSSLKMAVTRSQHQRNRRSVPLNATSFLIDVIGYFDSEVSSSARVQVLDGDDNIIATTDGISLNCFYDGTRDGYYISYERFYCLANNIISGYDNGMFGVNDFITREQLVHILFKYSGMASNISGGIDLLKYTDYMDVSSWAQESMKWAIFNDIIKGKDEETLDPKGFATRAEVAEIIRRFLILDMKSAGSLN